MHIYYGDILFSSLFAIMATVVKHMDRMTQKAKRELFAKPELLDMPGKHIITPKMEVTAQMAEEIKTSLATSSL